MSNKFFNALFTDKDDPALKERRNLLNVLKIIDKQITHMEEGKRISLSIEGAGFACDREFWVLNGHPKLLQFLRDLKAEEIVALNLVGGSYD